MRYLFIIQGEGRGHMTQALSMAAILRNAGHEVCHVIVGKSKRRNLPTFFTEKIGAPIAHLDSPNFATDKNQKSVKPIKTVFNSLWNFRQYYQSVNAIDQIVKTEKPDQIINFYDFLGGLYYFLKKPKIPLICIAHQYLIAHKDFDFPNGRSLDKKSLFWGNKVTALGASKLLALSFQKFEDEPDKKLFVVPPLLRDAVKTLAPTDENHILAYMVNSGYGDEIKDFHQSQPDQPIHCFWDKKDAPEVLEIDQNLHFHQLNDQKFLEKMASAKAYVSTAGFESVCEAMYLGKPVLMVPVAGHYEQACNAIDAKKAGAGISSNHFDIAQLIAYLPQYNNTASWFRPWADQSAEKFLNHLAYGFDQQKKTPLPDQ